MKRSEVLKYAQQGNPQAIALLLNHALKPQGIQTTVSLQAGTLHILLEGHEPPAQATYAAVVEQGLQKLQIAAIAKAHLYSRAVGTQVFAWKRVVPLQANPFSTAVDQNAVDQTATQAPTPLQRPSPRAEAQPGELQPGWGFWCGWLVMSLVGSAIAFIAMYYFASRLDRGFAITKVLLALLTFLSAGSIGLFVGLGQWAIFRREARWSHAWITRTATGTFISTVIGTFFGWYYQAVPTLPNGIMFWLLMVLPIVAFQWILLRQKLINALLWLVVPSVLCPLLGLAINFTLPAPFNMLDTVIIIHWMFYGLGGELMIWLLHQNGLIDPELQPKNTETYRLVSRRRYQFNHWFVLEWIGLTLMGWFVGRWLVTTIPLEPGLSALGIWLLQQLQGLPSALLMFTYSITVDLPNIVSLIAWLVIVNALQFVVLRQRLDRAVGWLVRSLLGASVGGIAILTFRATALLINNRASIGNVIVEPWELPWLVDESLSGLIMAGIWGTAVLAQLPFWQRRQFPVIGWLVANVGVLVFVILFSGLREDLHLLTIAPFIALMLPPLAISWMAAYSYMPATGKA
ncbi:MAG: hypothetical protein AAF722_18375 [Cyanobacteria bacterium P01_C01_bin.70]